MSKEVRIVLGIILGTALLFLSYKILRPFWPSLGWGLLLALFLDPIQQRLRKRMKKPFWPALLTTLMALLVVLIPLGLLLVRLAAEIATAYPAVRAQVEAIQQGALQHGSGFQALLEKITPILDKCGIQFSAVTTYFAAKFSDLAHGFFTNTINFMFDLFFTLVFTYVFLIYGKDLRALAERAIPVREDQKRELLSRMKDFTVATFRGNFFTGLLQGAIGFIGYLIFGVPSPLFFATLTSLFSLIPAGGTMLVWGPLGLFLLFTGQATKGVLLLIWGVVLIAGIENFLRPLLIAGSSKVNAMFVLVSALGGAAAFGVIGLFFGPILLYAAQEILLLISEREAPAKVEAP
jgi:predicted PurR-regulated permease PerM